MALQRLLIVTGDASGDVHGAKVVQALQEQAPHVEIHAVGGLALAETGIPILSSQESMGVFGLGIFSAIPSHLALAKRILQHCSDWKPDAVLLIDYGTFNLSLAQALKKQGRTVYYYIPPQVWASRPWRINKIKRTVDHVFCIFPFEEPLYKAKNVPVTFVGHPLVEQCTLRVDRIAFCQQYGLDAARPIVGVFPGSRRSEITRLLPAMLGALPLIAQSTQPKCQFVLVRSPAIAKRDLESWLAPLKPLLADLDFHVLTGTNHEILALSQACLVASGTVTLEAALYETPCVITYKVSRLASWLFRPFILVKHIGLPNLLSTNAPGFLPELLMDQVTPQNLCKAILPFLSDSPQRQVALQQFQQIRQALGHNQASKAVAQGLLQQVGKSTTAVTP